MVSFPIQGGPEDVTRELVELNRKLVKGIETLARIREDDVRIGVTPKDEVYRQDKLVLYRFAPVVERPFAIPLLIVYALVNRPYMVDLQEDRSLVRNLLELGLDVYLIDWGYPSRADRWLTLDDYVNGYVDDCVDVIRERHGLDRINLLGICQGGTLSLCYSALHPNKVKNLIPMVTPVDFGVQEGLLNLWAREIDGDLLVDAWGNTPGELMNFGFLMLKPFQLAVQKYVDLVDIMDDETKLLNFLRMEKWIFDSPDQAGEAFRQFVNDLYRDNKLIDGRVELGGQRVDLGEIQMPVLNIVAEQDHLVPPASSHALGKYVGTRDYTAHSFPVGHIGMYVSSKVQRALPPLIAEWLQARA